MLRKNCTEPYLSQLISGDKIVEGRVNKGDWANLRIGQQIYLYSNDNSGVFEVVNLHLVHNFKQLYYRFGHKLLPLVDDAETAAKIYGQWFRDELIQNHHVIGVELKYIK